MQFVQIAQFRPPVVEATKTSYLNPKGRAKIEKPRITCAAFSEPTQILTCGLSSGTIIQFANQKFSNKKLTATKDFEMRKYHTLPNQHKGEICCMLAERLFNQFFIITGSADRTIKIWDTEPKSKCIVQTLTGHAGTVICLAFSAKTDTIFSGSVDKSVRIWKQDEGRKLFMYPWYVHDQVLTDFCPKKSLDKPTYPTTFELTDGEISNFILYLGDSGGNLHIIRQFEISGFKSEQSSQDNSSTKFRTGFQIDRSNYKHHRLNINGIKYVPKEHLVMSIGYDQYLYGFESLSEKLTIKYQNPRKCLFTWIEWVHNLLLVADEQGSFYYLEIGSDRGIEEVKKYNCKINQLFASKGEIFAVTDYTVDVYCILKGIKTVEGENCHTDSIVGIYALEAYKLTDKKVKDQAKIVSVSLDNTMRVWDPADLSCLEIMRNPEKAEISSLFYLKRANLFVTGHENGLVRLWNIELQTSITISQQNSPFAHRNNICAFCEYIHVRDSEDITEFMFSAGYEGRVNVWEIFLKKSSVQSSLISSSIRPQLKNYFYPDESQENVEKIGCELFSLQIWEGRQKSTELEEVSVLSAGSKGYVYFTRVFTYETYHRQKLHEDSINCMLIDQNILFTGSCDHSIKLTNLEDLQVLSVLLAHESSITHLQILEETGHLITQAADGAILFWDYPSEKVVKAIKEKKETIICTCYINESKMIYFGTESAKILADDLSDLYKQPVNQRFVFKEKGNQDEDLLSEQSLNNLLVQNQQQLDQLRDAL